MLECRRPGFLDYRLSVWANVLRGWLSRAPGAAPARGGGAALADGGEGDRPWQTQGTVLSQGLVSLESLSNAWAHPCCSPLRRPVFGFAAYFPHGDIFYKNFFAVK